MLDIKYNYVSETLDLVDNFYPRKNEILCNFALNDGLENFICTSKKMNQQLQEKMRCSTILTKSRNVRGQFTMI